VYMCTHASMCSIWW